MSDVIRKDFARQALACELLGSPFTGQVCRLLGERLSDASRFGARVLSWKGNPQADALPLRVTGGFHALKRQGDAGLAKAYPPNGVDDEALWAALDAAIAGHDDFLHDFLDSAPQTNEVSRSNAILGAALHVAQRTGLPLAIREIGSSAGLNLGFDAYAYDLGAARWGDAASGVRIEAEWQGMLPPLDAKLEIASRKGCDLNPLDPANEADRERMLSYIWPDQTARLARIEAALDAAAHSGRKVEKADAGNWAEHEFAGEGRKGEVRVLMHTIVWQYLPAPVKTRIEAAIDKAGAAATHDAPLAWIGVEADAKDAASASVRLRLWPDGTDEELGRADFHGRWARWG